jgi:hypothetical protein
MNEEEWEDGAPPPPNQAELIAQDRIQFIIDNESDCYQKEEAQIFGITEKEQFIKIASAADIYALLDIRYNLSNYVGISVETTGWGAPLDEDGEIEGRPSEHEERRRLALVIVVTDKAIGSAVSFADDGVIITDPSASGGLAESLISCWARSRWG